MYTFMYTFMYTKGIAASLSALKELQDQWVVAIRTSQLSRTHRSQRGSDRARALG